jgi:outer membrane protein insertion porin family
LFSNKNYKTLSDNEKYNWMEYHKWDFKSEYYFSIIDKLVMATKAQFGYVGYYNKDIGYDPLEGFDLGGDGMSGYTMYGMDVISLRGYSNGSLTPRVYNGVVNESGVGTKSGNIYDKFSLEIRYPITLNPSATVYVLSFLEGGNCWYNPDSFSPFNIKRSAGVGFRAFLPMFGLLGIDWGYGFDAVPGISGANKSQFHFTLGQQL